MKNLVYKVSNRFFLTSRMTKRIEGRISILYPSTKYSIISKTSDYLIKIYLLAVMVIVLLMIFAELSLYYSVVIALVLYGVVNNKVYTNLDKLEMELLVEFQKFIEDVKYRYRFDGMVDEAVRTAINSSEYIMSIHGERLFSALKDNHIGNEEYEEISPNNFFMTFFVMCKNVIVYGDKTVGGESYFIKNITYLNEDIGIEILKRRKVNNVFMGLLNVTIIPVFAVKPIEKWAISNIPEIADSYNGLFGIISTLAVGFISYVIYRIIINLKYPYVNDNHNSKTIERLAGINSVKRAVLRFLKMNYKKAYKLEEKLKNTGYGYNIIEFYILRFSMAFAGVIGALILYVSICLSVGINMINIYFVPIVLGFGTVMFFYPYFNLLVKEKIMLISREEELVRFQTIILMLMETDRISVEDILKQMERFARSFRNVIEELRYRLPYLGMDAFRQIRGKAGFLGFDRLMDNFLACDYMSIHKAFADVVKEREYYIEKHKQDNEFMVEQRSVVAKVLSFIPLCAVILIKLIIPFVVEGISQMSIGGL